MDTRRIASEYASVLKSEARIHTDACFETERVELRPSATSLRGAHLAHGILRDCALHRADLRGATLSASTFYASSFDTRTRWPAGFTPSLPGLEIDRE